MAIRKYDMARWVTTALAAHPTIQSPDLEYIIDKCYKLTNLFIELEEKSLLKKLNRIETEKMTKQINNSLRNLEEFKQFYITTKKLLDNNRGVRKTINLTDQAGIDYQISGRQIIVLWCLYYSSFIETIKTVLSDIIIIEKPTGIGDLISKLKSRGVTHLEFFDDLDSNLRNSVFHLDFQITNDGILYEARHKPKLISFANLIKLTIAADRSTFASIIVTTKISNEI